MLLREAEWIAAQFARLSDSDLFPLVNIGSSTQAFRTQVQPYIDELVFAPLRERAGRVVHVDTKSDPGVDLVGAVGDPEVDARLRHLSTRTALVSNVLEHVEDVDAVARASWNAVPSGGHLVVTGPSQYPYHADPIDNGLRPSVEEAASLFPGTTLIDSAIIDGKGLLSWDPRERGGRTRTRMLARLLVPFYRPRHWVEAVGEIPFLVRPPGAFGVVLRRD